MPLTKLSAAPASGSTRVVTPARNVLGSLRLTGDKSISHRYAMLAGFAEGTSRLTNFSSGADPHSTLACVEQLGTRVEREENVEREDGGADDVRGEPDAPLLGCEEVDGAERELGGERHVFELGPRRASRAALIERCPQLW